MSTDNLIQQRIQERFQNDQPVSEGRVVHFVLQDGKTIRPAMVVRTWSKTCVQLVVLHDGTNDNEARGHMHPYDSRAETEAYGKNSGYKPGYGLVEWVTSVTYDGGEMRETETVDAASGKATRHRVFNNRSWHWPPRA